jgi:hypothetical protein
MKLKHVFYAALLGGALVSEPYWATDDAHAAKTLASQNLTPTKIGSGFSDYGWFRCGLDVYTTKFEATNQQGEKVSGYVCSNPFSKGSSLDINNR